MPNNLFTPSMFAKFTVNLQIISILLFILLPFDGYVFQTFILHVDKLINIFPSGKYFFLRSKCGLDSSSFPYALFCQSFPFCVTKKVPLWMSFLMFYRFISPTSIWECVYVERHICYICVHMCLSRESENTHFTLRFGVCDGMKIILSCLLLPFPRLDLTVCSYCCPYGTHNAKHISSAVSALIPAYLFDLVQPY